MGLSENFKVLVKAVLLAPREGGAGKEGNSRPGDTNPSKRGVLLEVAIESAVSKSYWVKSPSPTFFIPRVFAFTASENRRETESQQHKYFLTLNKYR